MGGSPVEKHAEQNELNEAGPTARLFYGKFRLA